MKPSDLYVSSRQFFGYFVPGTMWLGALVLITGQNLITFFTKGNPWIITAGFIVVSYAIGYAVQKMCFKPFDPPPDVGTELFDKFNKEMKNLMTENNLNWNKSNFPELCKWYVLENTVQLKTILFEREVGINFRIAIPPSLFILAFGIFVYGFWETKKFIIIGAFGCIIVGFLWKSMWSKVDEKRKTEREEWCKMFLLLRNLKKEKERSGSAASASADANRSEKDDTTDDSE